MLIDPLCYTHALQCTTTGVEITKASAGIIIYYYRDGKLLFKFYSFISPFVGGFIGIVWDQIVYAMIEQLKTDIDRI